ncbi:MAG: ATP-binding protein, partial [Chloroflexi bacterium]|nr:ATP-binding protein [Chloroflexota bacterium]
IEAATRLGMIPDLPLDIVATLPNGAGMGAAIFLSDDGFALGERLAARAKQIDLDQASNFHALFVAALRLKAN